jgi:parvulin-like peptidyl-prolyl isomerase
MERIVWRSLAGLVILLSAPWAQAKLIDEVALVVNQEAMTRGEMEESIQAFFLAQRLQPAKPGTAAYERTKNLVAEAFIREVLLAEEADRLGIMVSDAEVERETDREIDAMKKGFPTEKDFEEGLRREGLALDDLKADVRARLKRRIRANRAMRHQQQALPGGVAVTDEEARSHFGKNPQDYEQVKFAVILFRVPAGAKPEYVQEVDKQVQAVLVELKGGADFAAYARKYSEDKGSSERGGVMGNFYRSELDPKLAKGIFAIPEKGLGIVRAPEGLYIVRVDKKQKADYALVAKEIKDSLQKGGQEAGLQKWFEGLRKNAHITLDGRPYAGGPTEGEGAPSGMAQAKGGKERPADKDPIPQGTPTSGELNPTLPAAGGLILGASLEGFSYFTDDLGAFHNPGTTLSQDLPFGIGLQAGLDYALDPSFLVGLQLEFLRKFTASVTEGSDRYLWDGAALAPSLTAKLLIPLDETTNFVLGLSGGYHLLMAGGLTFETPAGQDKVDLASEAFGGKVGAGVEFFLDEDMNSSVGFSVDYRHLSFTDLRTQVRETAGGGSYADPLENLTGGQKAHLDLSGINVGLHLRFYLGKD